MAGTAAAEAKTAAIKAVGGGTAGEVTTNYTRNGYEVTVTKSNGSKVEVHLDSSFNAIPGPGGPIGQQACDGGPAWCRGPRQLPYGKKQIPDRSVAKPHA